MLKKDNDSMFRGAVERGKELGYAWVLDGTMLTMVRPDGVIALVVQNTKPEAFAELISMITEVTGAPPATVRPGAKA